MSGTNYVAGGHVCDDVNARAITLRGEKLLLAGYRSAVMSSLRLLTACGKLSVGIARG